MTTGASNEVFEAEPFECRRELDLAIKNLFMVQGIAKKTCDVLSMISSFHSALVEVSDLESGVADYARLLGREPGPIETVGADKPRSVFFRLENMRLEIREVSASTAEASQGLKAIRLVCDDVGEIAARFEADAPSLLKSEKGRAESERESESDVDPRAWVSTPVDPIASRGLPVELISDEVGPTIRSSGEMSNEGDGVGVGVGDRDGVDLRSMVRGLDHVVVMSADIEATRDFYRDDLGIRLALDRSFEKRGVRLVFFRIAGVTIEIGGRLDTPRDPKGRDRFGGLAWQVIDLDAIHSRLSNDGFDVSRIRDGNKAGTRVCTVREPVHDVPTLLIEPIS